jgi:putative FmdB family regulatory protein
MPFYEYECPACKYYAEVLQKISDKPLRKCPSCGKAGFKRLMSAPVFRLKGSGWYETDFKSDQDGKRNLAGAEREEPKPAAPEAKSATDNTAPGTASAATPKVDAAPAKAEKTSPLAAPPEPRRGRQRAAKAPAKAPAKTLAKRAAKPAARRAKRGARRR